MALHPGMKKKLQSDWDVKSHIYLKGCDARLSGTQYTNISTRLPSIYRMWQALRLWLMMILLWGLSRWQSTAPNQLLISSFYLHTNTCALVLFIFLITWSAPTLTFLCFFPTPVLFRSLFFFFVSDQCRLFLDWAPNAALWCIIQREYYNEIYRLSYVISHQSDLSFSWGLSYTLKFSKQAILVLF